MAFTDLFEEDCGGPCNIAKRYGKLLCSIWMIGDIIMQVLITKKYYELASTEVLLSKNKSSNPLEEPPGEVTQTPVLPKFHALVNHLYYVNLFGFHNVLHAPNFHPPLLCINYVEGDILMITSSNNA